MVVVTRYGDGRNGLDDPASPVWDAREYAVSSGASGHVVHAVEPGGLVCRGSAHAGTRAGADMVVKEPATIPRGYHPVCSSCDRVLRGDD